MTEMNILLIQNNMRNVSRDKYDLSVVWFQVVQSIHEIMSEFNTDGTGGTETSDDAVYSEWG